jgi:hypothetical protein
LSRIHCSFEVEEKLVFIRNARKSQSLRMSELLSQEN